MNIIQLDIIVVGILLRFYRALTLSVEDGKI